MPDVKELSNLLNDCKPVGSLKDSNLSSCWAIVSCSFLFAMFFYSITFSRFSISLWAISSFCSSVIFSVTFFLILSSTTSSMQWSNFSYSYSYFFSCLNKTWSKMTTMYFHAIDKEWSINSAVVFWPSSEDREPKIALYKKLASVIWVVASICGCG